MQASPSGALRSPGGSATLNLGGTVKPRRVVSRKGVESFVWDNGTGVDATVQLANADMKDVLQIAGQQGKYDITGTIAANAHVGGSVDNLSGSGTLSLKSGRGVRRAIRSGRGRSVGHGAG